MRAFAIEIEGIAPYSQSKKLTEGRAKDESWDEFETRVWRDKAHVVPGKTNGGGKSIVIPAHGIHQALVVGARKGRLVPKAAKSAREGLAKRLESGISVMDDAQTTMTLETARACAINAHANGKRGSGTRVTRVFPEWDKGWKANFVLLILDPSLTTDDLEEALKWAGLVCGLGRFRPENMGSSGRFKPLSVETTEVFL